ncbi:MAG: ribosome small subunit-dependent GTPase A [Candidatus Azobacteroides pseudotrichonymphae]|jgi:ribosome biogenesis GTPase|uniref:Small ribosomal subunit biogenesis GTPase RsgA n=1 Tax=Azobacteroides pseudotrichonymphae genomovar. CFP2 TaxID=511995 RepID=RSGA_AZOPC|nr:ribosome small subunit-dependent GTPase A [Candidatus Azobacteroides pseudotrichonymphae]B6YS07.1 RecName: Full=Small ribosomal subunit biogenesis GTPase RsgA [Candidatus Azobacteroides pseudotrichonymphae genomovar. CFP2]MDR0530407.1 ribosome small subunit-dependent GTPase A [Bacteroidales bacterium OttesenSCG-928-I14]BAG83979.1 putative GTPase EngC [Candidatus Azobacteroides pseudotrichonymphae genomovar. CFP2]GMO33862.1 MAG: ribosome small subunit-dependent GTPase A [Candidatus Azobactero
MKGLVIKNTGSWYQLKTDRGELIKAKLKGNFRLKGIQSTNPISIGDYVLIEKDLYGTAFISTIEDRKNYIIRRASNLSKQSHIIATNLDQAFLIVTVNYPITTTIFIDRFLVTTEAYRIPTLLFFNKTDLYNNHDMNYADILIHLYKSIGYSCYKIAATKDEDLLFMEKLLRGKITLFYGHSGVGKSTIVNRLIPNAKQKVQSISKHHNKGMHTTTFSKMLELPSSSGYIIDTPGIKGFGIFDIEKEEISHYFPDIFRFSPYCKFYNCTHQKEPACAVREAIKNHYISKSRYISYINILEDVDMNKYREAF